MNHMKTTRTNSGNAVHSRGRSVVTGLSRAIAIVLVAVVIGALVHDVFTKQDAGETFRIEDESKVPYRANMKINNVHYREETGAFVGTLTAEIFGNDEKKERISISYRRNADVTTDWLHSSRCSTIQGDGTINGTEQYVYTVECGVVDVLQSEIMDQWRYPFDKYEIPFAPRACVDQKECNYETENVWFESLSVTIAEPNFLSSSNDSSQTVILSRPFVLKVVSTAFLFMALVFLVHLWRLSRDNSRELFSKSLGFFATLWAFRIFLVPESITAFPTLVDYALVSLFTLLFAMLLVRMGDRGDER